MSALDSPSTSLLEVATSSFTGVVESPDWRSALALALAATALTAMVTLLGPRLEKFVFRRVAARLWSVALASGRPTTAPASATVTAKKQGATRRLHLGAAFDSLLVLVASGPFKAPFGASIVLLSLSGKLTPGQGCALLLFLYVLRCASTGQPLSEGPQARAWLAEHGPSTRPSMTPKWPREGMSRLARATWSELGAFEREDCRAYLSLACLVLAASPGLPDATTHVLAVCAFLMPASLALDTWRIFGRDPHPMPLKRGRARPALLRTSDVALAFALASLVSLPMARAWPHARFALAAAGAALLFAALAAGAVGFLLGRGAPDATTRTPAGALIVDPDRVMKMRFARDVGVSSSAAAKVPLFRWLRMRARIQALGFAPTVRASSRLDLLLTTLVVSTLLL